MLFLGVPILRRRVSACSSFLKTPSSRKLGLSKFNVQGINGKVPVHILLFEVNISLKTALRCHH